MKAFLSQFNLALLLPITWLMLATVPANAQQNSKREKKVLFVVTSHDRKGNTGEATGYYLSEVSHPWDKLIAAGYEVDFVSPRGGKAPVDGFNLDDPINRKFWNDPAYRYKIEHTQRPSDVNAGDYIAIHYAGGHGAMWDFADNAELAAIAARIYENGGVVSAVCHGPAGLVNIKLSNGRYLVDGKAINAFTNEEEMAVKLDRIVPFLLESKLIERGANFEKSGLWQPHVSVDQRVITGQNPQSAGAVGDAIVNELRYQRAYAVITQYEVKQAYKRQFGRALHDYTAQALLNKNNIMAEVYTDQDAPAVFWVIERWSDKNSYQQFNRGAQARAVRSLSSSALVMPTRSIEVRDLEPFPETHWQNGAGDNDDLLTIMLFVDAKSGTEINFKTVYHKAMPQFRSEPGVINYQLSQFEDDDTKFVTYEKFRDEKAFQYHLNFPPIQPVIDYLNTSIMKQPFQQGLHRLKAFKPGN